MVEWAQCLVRRPSGRVPNNSKANLLPQNRTSLVGKVLSLVTRGISLLGLGTGAERRLGDGRSSPAMGARSKYAFLRINAWLPCVLILHRVLPSLLAGPLLLSALRLVALICTICNQACTARDSQHGLLQPRPRDFRHKVETRLVPRTWKNFSIGGQRAREGIPRP